MKVTLTLPNDVAERLRAMCHRRDLTASDLIAKWIAQHDDHGHAIHPPLSASILDGILGGARK